MEPPAAAACPLDENETVRIHGPKAVVWISAPGGALLEPDVPSLNWYSAGATGLELSQDGGKTWQHYALGAAASWLAQGLLVRVPRASSSRSFLITGLADPADEEPPQSRSRRSS